MLPLFLLFVVLPIAEIMILINVSASIGGINTFLIVIVTAALGAYFVRQQGFSLIQQIQVKLNAGETPGTEMAEALLLLVAGVLLITPGFITDALGLLFTLPISRASIARFIMHKIVVNRGAQAQFYKQNFRQPTSPPEFDKGETIDGEFTNKSQNDEKNRLN